MVGMLRKTYIVYEVSIHMYLDNRGKYFDNFRVIIIIHWQRIE